MNGGPGGATVVLARFVPKMVTREPRAATGTLEALLPVALFTNAPI
jgi:hypothetical protein